MDNVQAILNSWCINMDIALLLPSDIMSLLLLIKKCIKPTHTCLTFARFCAVVDAILITISYNYANGSQLRIKCN